MTFMGVTCPGVVEWLEANHKMKLNVVMFTPKSDITTHELAIIMQWRLPMNTMADTETMKQEMPAEALRHFVLHESPKAGEESQSQLVRWLLWLPSRISSLWRLLRGLGSGADKCRDRLSSPLEEVQTATAGGPQ